MPEKVLYSTVLQDFARPLLNEKDSEEIFMQKMKIIEVIWNYCIAKEFKLLIFEVLDKIITQQKQMHPSMKLVLEEFIKYKKTDFGKYKNFIVKVEYRMNNNGVNTLHVESAHPQNFKKAN